MERAATTAEPVTEPLGGRGAGGDGGELVLGRYRLRGRLGAGGFGVVWRALDEKLEREVAVKAMPRDPGGAGARAEREARAAARLNHPGIVALYELGHDDACVYLVSELVHGGTLAELSREGVLSDRDVARVGKALCDALAHAHERGVIHRDVKPQNVIVVAEPAAGAGFAKLADFGVAHLAAGDPLTGTGDVLGTLAYMAPEQAEGERVTPAADIYSLALTLYEAWTGRNPVRAASPAATARRLGTRLPPLGRLRRDLPGGLCRAIDAALDPLPERRPGVAELREALAAAESALSDEGGLVEPGTLERFGIASRRQRASGPLRLAVRMGAGLAASALMLTALERLGPPPPLDPLAAAATVAALVALLPRAGWLAAGLGLAGWLASPEAGREGTALVVAAVAIPVPLLLPRLGVAWSLPAAAPLLGAAALGPLFVALAGLAGGSARRRAALGALGFCWLALAEVIAGDALLFGPVDGTLGRGSWEDSLGGAAADAIGPLVTSPALAPAAVWAAFAALLPLAVRGRSLALDVIGGGLWAAALVTVHRGLGDLLASSTELGEARGAVAGAVLGACAAVAVAAVRAEHAAEPRVPSRMDPP